VDGHEVSLVDHPMNVDVERADRAEEVLNRPQAVPGLRVVRNVALDDQLVEGVGGAGAKLCARSHAARVTRPGLEKPPRNRL
jgi:hypothetical protein